MSLSLTKMKNLGTQEGFDILELGDLLYLLLPKEPVTRVIISAHGGREVVSRTNSFVVPSDVVLRFYSDDDKSVLDPGFDNFYRGEAAPKEILSEGEQSFDYLLSKYQGTNNETYDSIARVMAGAINLKRRLLADAAKQNTTEKNRNTFLNAAAREKVAAVLTIRNRFFKGDATLSNVVQAVKTAAPSIVVFDCLFCRSIMHGGSGGSDAVPIISRLAEGKWS